MSDNQIQVRVWFEVVVKILPCSQQQWFSVVVKSGFAKGGNTDDEMRLCMTKEVAWNEYITKVCPDMICLEESRLGTRQS